MSRSVGDYRPCDAEHAVLYRVIDEHLDAFLETSPRQTDGVPLPAFVEQEFYDFLTCGVLAHGFARLRCTERTREVLAEPIGLAPRPLTAVLDLITMARGWRPEFWLSRKGCERWPRAGFVAGAPEVTVTRAEAGKEGETVLVAGCQVGMFHLEPDVLAD